MKRFSLRTYVPLVLTAFIMLMPLVGLAQSGTFTPSTPPGTLSPSTPPGTLTPAPTQTPSNSYCSPGELCNPLKAYNFCAFIKIVLDAILIIGLPIAVLFLVYVGFTFILAQGKPDKITEAQRNFLNTVIGIAIFLGAWTIAKILQATLVGLGATGVNQC